MDVKELFSHLVALKDTIRSYLETTIAYYGVTAFEKAAKVFSFFMVNLVVLVVGLLALLFLSGAAALYLGEYLDSYALGMLIVGGFYLLVLLIVFVLRKQIFGRFAIRALKNIILDERSKSKKGRANV
ncbi:MAG: hypothetical protein ACQESY_09960 [Pseudomonadota bacterium]